MVLRSLGRDFHGQIATAPGSVVVSRLRGDNLDHDERQSWQRLIQTGLGVQMGSEPPPLSLRLGHWMANRDQTRGVIANESQLFNSR